MTKEGQLATVEVPTEDLSEEQKKKQEEKDHVPESQRPHLGDPKLAEVLDMTEEDKELKEKLDNLLEQLRVKVPSKSSKDIEEIMLAMHEEIKTATSSMTSVPKPLKFLRPHYEEFKSIHNQLQGKSQQLVADVISVLGMTIPSDELSSLKYRLVGSGSQVSSWGHEYVRNLAGEISQEFVIRLRDERSVDDLLDLVKDIVPYSVNHNAESEACDLLLEVDRLDWIQEYISEDNCDRVCLYLLSFANYVADNEELIKVLKVSYDIYKKFMRLPDALRVALKLDQNELILEVFSLADNPIIKNQLGFIMASQKLVLEEFLDDEDLMEIIGNSKLHESYLNLARDLDVLEVKSPEDVYKTHLLDDSSLRRHGGNVDSAKHNLASTFVNAFVNCGFSSDALLTPESSQWVFKNKEMGKLSAVASLGLIYLWDLENGFSVADKYSYHAQELFRSGSLLATGLVSSGVTSDMDAAFALLSEHLEDKQVHSRVSSILGLGIAYAGSGRDDILELLTPFVGDQEQPFEVSASAALALGMVFVSKCNDDVSGSILEAFMTRSETDLSSSMAPLMCLGLALLYTGKGEAAEAILEALRIIEHDVRDIAAMSVNICAFAGTGNVLQIQQLLATIGKTKKTDQNEGEGENENEEEDHQNTPETVSKFLAVIGIAVVGMGENIGVEMSLRLFDSFLQYGDIYVKRAIPLALGLINVSSPKISAMETLNKLSHDNDEFVSQNAILALGLIGAGTNNSRIAQSLRQLSIFYGKEPNHLFLVRIAQGFVHMGKGLVSLNPFHSDGFLMSRVSFCGLLPLMYCMLDPANTVLGEKHYLMFTLAAAIRPRMLITLDEQLQPLTVSVRVGQSVDTVGLAGKPKSITGFQTHTTPVLIGHGERVELATEEYLPYSRVLEGFVILKKNPEYKEPEE